MARNFVPGFILRGLSLFRSDGQARRPAPRSKPSQREDRELVVVLHGLGVTHRWMSRIADALEAEGYRVVNRTYPSCKLPLEQLGAQWLPQLLHDHNAAGAPLVHFVTHSMGGIVVRLWLRACGDSPPPNLGRIVMIAPPNQGSEVPDRLRGFPLFHWFTGVNGPRLGTGDDSLPRQLSPDEFPADAELGVIAGNRSLNPLFSAWIDGESDGTVSVASTRISGMRDHIVMPHSHTGILLSRDVAAQAVHFLREGKFTR